MENLCMAKLDRLQVKWKSKNYRFIFLLLGLPNFLTHDWLTLSYNRHLPFRIESAVFGSCHLVIIFAKSNWAESILDQFGNSFSKSSIILESITNAGRRGYSSKDSEMIAINKILFSTYYARDIPK